MYIGIVSNRNRILSIDWLRGFVMIIMALDHVRDYFHFDAFFYDPTDLTQTSGPVFWTRFITHFCAPVFVFLAGTSAFFVSQRRSKKKLSIWLLKRGIWLIIAELTIIKLAWFFKLDYSAILLQVIWVLGLSMIFLAGFIHLPKKITILICLIFVLGHNTLDGISGVETGFPNLWNFLHVQTIVNVKGVILFIGYPIIPWVFLMPLGFYFGQLYLPEVSKKLRIKRLRQIGISMITLFVVLRLINLYGDPFPWKSQSDFGHTVLSFFNVAKYPPSLLYLLITLGPSVLLLSFAENWSGKLNRFIIVFGRVPMFYYIVHLFLIHGIASIAAMLTGYSASDMVIDFWVTMQPNLQGYGFSLWVVYVVWILVILGLYPICKWYDKYKTNNRDKWWLSYL